MKSVTNSSSVGSENITANDLVKTFDLGRSTVIRYLKQGSKAGWCNYNPKEERKINGIKRGKSKSKPILIYDKEMNFIGEYESARWIEQHSIELFGVNLDSRSISTVCNGKRKTHKGYIFRFKETC